MTSGAVGIGVPVGPSGAGGADLSGPPPSAGGRRRRRRKLTFDRVSFFAVFLGLPVLVFLVLVIWPFIQAVYYSTTDWSGFSKGFNSVGFDQFTKLYHDDIFRKALRNNAILAIVVPFVTIAIALTFSTMITIGGPSHGAVQGIRNSSLYRVVSFFPYVVPAIVIGLIWAQVFDPSSGLLNGLLTGIGLDGFKSYPWLGDSRTAMLCLIFVIVWAGVGFYMVLFIASIKDLPAEIFEAARLDGAGRFRIATRVVLPLIRNNLQTAYIYIGITALDAFVFTQAMTPTGGPNNGTLVMSQLLFRTAFSKGQFGYASAMGVVLAVVTLVFAGLVFLVFWLTGGRKDRIRKVKGESR